MSEHALRVAVRSERGAKEAESKVKVEKAILPGGKTLLSWAGRGGAGRGWAGLSEP